MDFSQALNELKRGHACARAGWNGPGQWVNLRGPQGGVTEPFLALKNAQGGIVPWLPSQGDLFAKDWRVVTPQ